MIREQRSQTLSVKRRPLFALLFALISFFAVSAGPAGIRGNTAQFDGEIERQHGADLNENVPDDETPNADDDLLAEVSQSQRDHPGVPSLSRGNAPNSELSPDAAFALAPLPSFPQEGELSPDAAVAVPKLGASSSLLSSVTKLKPPQNPPVSAMQSPKEDYFLQQVSERASQNEGQGIPVQRVWRGARPLARRPSRYASPPQIISNAVYLAQRHAAEGKADSGGRQDIKSMRPSAANGVADIVKFSLFVKGFFGINLKDNKFTVDAIFGVKWKDSRAAALVPSGVDHISMSGKTALSKIWMPEVVITNRDIKRLDVISTSVTIFKTGDVTKVERSGVTINQMFDLEEYPFDSQKLHVKIASSKYMLEEVVLEPEEDRSLSGSSDGMLKGSAYDLKSWRIFAFAETDGALKKSRGVLELVVKRKFEVYRENHLMPTCLLLIISWGVFFFPFENPFITPRLALSILALLAFTNLMIKSTSVLPDGAPYNWNDCLNSVIQAMMFCTIVVNILSEICKHKLKLDALGATLNNEAKILIPITGIIVVFIVMSAGGYRWMSLDATAIVTKVFIVIVVGSYIAVASARMSSAPAAKQRAPEEAKA